MHVKLVVIEGDVKTPEIRLRIPAVIGRGRGASLQIPHALVSRQHCELLDVEGKLRIRDLGSLNGTLVDGKKVAEAELLSGHTLTVGAITFRVEYGPEVRTGDSSVNVAGVPPAVASPSGIGGEKPGSPKTDHLNVNMREEVAKEVKRLAQERAEHPEVPQEEFVDFLADETPNELSPETPQAAPLLPPTAGAAPVSMDGVPAPVAPLAIPVAVPAPVVPPVVPPVAQPVNPPAPVATPPLAATPPIAATPANPPGDDDDDLRAFLRSLSK